VKDLHDISIVLQRRAPLVVRKPLRVLLGIAQPVVYLALPAQLLKPAPASMDVGAMVAAYRIYLPGIVVAVALAGGPYTGARLLEEISSGVVGRARVAPVTMARFTFVVVAWSARQVARAVQ
jgi:ABC-2 type transport system permease protein